MESAHTLEEINQYWQSHCLCALKESATQSVPGVGNPDAEILFLGEAPGRDEDIKGEPFVGAAGKFLTEMLADIGLAREDVYITNVVKYRPPNNRDPEPEEVEACWPWLKAQLEAIQPKVVVLLGKHALHRFFPGGRISHMHGKLLKRKNSGLDTQYFFALYHPAAALYNGSMREVLKTDFQKLPKVVEMIEQEKTHTKAEENAEEARGTNTTSAPANKQQPEQKDLFG